MATGVLERIRKEKRGKPTWEMALLYPSQGTWSEEEYFSLPAARLVEFVDGSLEFLPMPTETHQAISAFLYSAFLAFVSARNLGKVFYAPLSVKVAPGKYREPDLVFLRTKHFDRRRENYWDGADLVVEIVSRENRKHDLAIKRSEYAQAGIPEYWIVDPQEETITVLKLAGKKYEVHGAFSKGKQATSALLPGLEVDVKAALEAK